jgi:hypothetical protein
MDGKCDLSIGLVCPDRFDCILPIGESLLNYCIRQGLGVGETCSSDCRGQGCLLPEITPDEIEKLDY